MTDDWTVPTLPAFHVPVNGAAAAAALPLAITGIDDPSPSAPMVLPAQFAPHSTADEQEVPGTQDVDAAQLAAVILRTEELVQAEPLRADLHRKLGFLLAKQGRSAEAADQFRRAVECGRRRLNG